MRNVWRDGQWTMGNVLSISTYNGGCHMCAGVRNWPFFCGMATKTQPQFVLRMFLFWRKFQPQFSYKIVLIKRKECIASLLPRLCAYAKVGIQETMKWLKKEHGKPRKSHQTLKFTYIVNPETLSPSYHTNGELGEGGLFKTNNSFT